VKSFPKHSEMRRGSSNYNSYSGSSSMTHTGSWIARYCRILHGRLSNLGICTTGRLTNKLKHIKSPFTDTLYGLGLGGQVGDSEWVGFRDLENGLAQIHSLKGGYLEHALG
jgi:hypothetical protein